MTSFLQLVAQDLYVKTGGDFSRTVIVFPNKRAGLFMNEHLLACAEGKPVWAPRYLTINDLFRSFAPDIAVNDTIDTTLRIIFLFAQLTRRDITVDWFYGWAERLLADFDDVDKNMADARQLFQNVSDWRAFDDTSFLSEDQVRELQRFFSEFNPEQNSEVRERYQQLWDILYPLYRQLNDQLADEHLAYEGALFRHVVEGLQSGQIQLPTDADRYVIVGFNVLDRVEQQLFLHLKREGKAIFYWDYDEYYTNALANEAGTFLRENLKQFPGQLPAEHFRNLACPKDIRMVRANTEAIQAQYVAPWIKSHKTPDPRQTAVVICNETLLQPVLHSLPEDVGELNITKGFPLGHTEVATLVEQQLNEWERQKTQLPVTELLARLSDLVLEHTEEFVTHDSFSAKHFEDVLQSEGYHTMYTILNRFSCIMERHPITATLSLVTLRRLLRSVIRQAAIPFHGEPARGLQIMGVLETRCLDFDSIIMLSVNDGVLPKKSSDNSFIPYILRRAFGLTTSERRTAVYAYYFYRLLQRASHVTLTYNISTDGMSTGEMSRFMTQLLVEWPHTIHHYALSSSQRTIKLFPCAVATPPDIIQRLTREDHTHPSLSPSALGLYLKCPLQFYYQQVLGIREPEDTSGQIKPNVFGSIFHSAAEFVYRPFIEDEEMIEKYHGRVTAKYLKELAADTEKIRQYVRDAFRANKVEYSLLEAHVIELYLINLLHYDARNGDFIIVGTETKAHCYVDVPHTTGNVCFRINGTVDRIDFIGSADTPHTLRVVDYKTGGGEASKAITTAGGDVCLPPAVAQDIAEVFSRDGGRGYILQTYLYYAMLLNKAKNDPQIASKIKFPVMPVLFFIRMASNPRYVPTVRLADNFVTDIRTIAPDMDKALKDLIAEIINPDIDFTPTADTYNCKNCKYKSICEKPREEDSEAFDK